MVSEFSKAAGYKTDKKVFVFLYNINRRLELKFEKLPVTTSKI